jgi:hypothetical protein
LGLNLCDQGWEFPFVCLCGGHGGKNPVHPETANAPFGQIEGKDGTAVQFARKDDPFRPFALFGQIDDFNGNLFLKATVKQVHRNPFLFFQYNRTYVRLQMEDAEAFLRSLSREAFRSAFGEQTRDLRKSGSAIPGFFHETLALPVT